MKRILTTTAIFIAFLLTLATVIVVLRLPSGVLTLIASGILISIILIAIACIWYIRLMAKENLGIKRNDRAISNANVTEAQARAEAAKLMARVIHTPHFTGIVQRQLEDGSVDIASLHNNPMWQINGHREPATQAELLAWQAYNRRGSSGKEIAQIQSGLVIEHKPTLEMLIDQYPHIWIHGGTGGGKTTLLRWIAHRRKMQGHDVVVLDSKEHPAKWSGLTRIRQPEMIESTIQKVFSIHQQNSSALSAGHAIEDEFRQITIISDEWTSIVRESQLACQFTDEMTREARKTGIHLVIATQTNLAADIGLSGRYKVIGGFLQIELIKLPNGEHGAHCKVANKALGEFMLPAPIPTPPMLPTGYDAPTIETVEVQRQMPVGIEQQVIELAQSGMSQKQISEAVWGAGKFGKFYNEKIAAILEKWGVEVEE